MKRLSIIALMGLTACGRSGFDQLSVGGDGGGTSDEDAAADGDVTTDPDAVDAPAGGGTVVGATFLTFVGASQPPARRSSGAALDPAAPEKLWMYGGYNTTFQSDVHYFTPSTNTWSTPATSGTSPGTRERHALAWDPVDSALVIFGGQNRPTIPFVHYDTLHVLVAGAWAQIPKAGTWPAARKDATLVWVPHLSKFLLYGGNDGGAANNRFSDLHLLTLDASAGTGSWQLLTPGGVAPPAQSAGCVVYDPAGRRLIVHGGETADGVDNNLTYQYLVDTNAWQLDTTTGTPPVPESFQQCAWDPVNKRVMLFGGQRDGGDPIDGHYIYDPDAKFWSSPPTTTNPGAHADGGATYSPALAGMLWYGGRLATTTYTSEVVLMKLDVQ